MGTINERKDVEKMMFVNTAWMRSYKGLKNDPPQGKFGWIKGGNPEHAMFNFLPFANRIYGFVPPGGDKININRLGAKKEDKSISGVLVIWMATHPEEGGRRIVGWYKNARVYRKFQGDAGIRGRTYKNERIVYHTRADASNCKLIPPDGRVFKIPGGKKNFPGEYPVWYAENIRNNFRRHILEYVKRGNLKTEEELLNSRSVAGYYQRNLLLRNKIEKKAIQTITTYYSKFGYKVNSVEDDNLGWDLEAELDKKRLLLEVKGLQGSQILTELTPNEYRNVKNKKPDYRICVVTNALSHPKMSIFQYIPKSKNWVDNDGKELHIVEKTAARISAGKKGV